MEEMEYSCYYVAVGSPGPAISVPTWQAGIKEPYGNISECSLAGVLVRLF